MPKLQKIRRQRHHRAIKTLKEVLLLSGQRLQLFLLPASNKMEPMPQKVTSNFNIVQKKRKKTISGSKQFTEIIKGRAKEAKNEKKQIIVRTVRLWARKEFPALNKTLSVDLFVFSSFSCLFQIFRVEQLPVFFPVKRFLNLFRFLKREKNLGFTGHRLLLLAPLVLAANVTIFFCLSEQLARSSTHIQRAM